MPRRFRAILALSFGNGLVMLDSGIANVALPSISRDLHTDGSVTVLVVTVYQLVLLMTLLPFSALGPKVGLARLYQVGQAIFAIGTLLCFFANSLPFLIVVRMVQGLGAACVLSVSSALIRDTYGKDSLGRGLAVNTVVITSAAALAPTLGGFILGVASWPWVFAIALPFAILSLVFGRSLPTRETLSEPYDLLSACMSAATFGLIVGGIESGVHGDSPVVSAAIVGAGIVIAILFVRRELDVPRPVIPFDMLGQPVMRLSALGAFCAFVASMMLLVSLPFRLESVYDFSPEEVGAMLAAWPFSMMIFAPLSGFLADRYPAGLLGGIGMLVAVGALIAIAMLPDDAHHFDIAWRMALCGVGFGMFFTPNARLMIGSVPSDRTPAAGGLVATVRLMGQTMGATAAAALFAAGLGGGAVPGFLSAGLAAIAGICSLARLRPALRQPDREEVEEARFPGG
jgi:DHA2 family multidrug resistance protein-like MFS transporter